MTLVEVIIGITLLVLIGSIGLVKCNLSNYKVDSFTKQIVSDIRYIRRVNKLGDSSACIGFIRKNNCSGYVLRENGENIKSVFLPENVELQCPVGKLLFKRQGDFYMGGTTISIIQNNSYTEITIVPVSGRVLIKEGIYK